MLHFLLHLGEADELDLWVSVPPTDLMQSSPKTAQPDPTAKQLFLSHCFKGMFLVRETWSCSFPPTVLSHREWVEVVDDKS